MASHSLLCLKWSIMYIRFMWPCRCLVSTHFLWCPPTFLGWTTPLIRTAVAQFRSFACISPSLCNKFPPPVHSPHLKRCVCSQGFLAQWTLLIEAFHKWWQTVQNVFLLFVNIILNVVNIDYVLGMTHKQWIHYWLKSLLEQSSPFGFNMFENYSLIRT